MDSVNLLESPSAGLQTEAKHRKKYLLLIFTTWFLCMGLILGLTYYMKLQQEKKIFALQTESLLLEPKILLYQDQKLESHRQNTSQCTAYRLKALFASPIKGLYLNHLRGDESWALAGTADNIQALDQIHDLIDQHLEHPQWDESYSNGVLDFQVQGKLLC